MKRNEDPGLPRGFQAILCQGCFLGLAEPARDLIGKGVDINAQGGVYGNALLAASTQGHRETVKLLLEKGADINAQGGHFGNALAAASSEDHQKINELLLEEKGADTNAQAGCYDLAES